jgi:hypothetical protein
MSKENKHTELPQGGKKIYLQTQFSDSEMRSLSLVCIYGLPAINILGRKPAVTVHAKSCVEKLWLGMNCSLQRKRREKCPHFT